MTKEEVSSVIAAAFAEVPFPGPEHRSLYQAEAWDDYAECDQSKDHKGHWQDLPPEQMRECQYALPHLDAQGLRYYLPALMTWALCAEGTGDQDAIVFDSLLYTLEIAQMSGSSLAYARTRLGALSPDQMRAVAEFLNYYGGDADSAALWSLLAEGEEWPDEL